MNFLPNGIVDLLNNFRNNLIFFFPVSFSVLRSCENNEKIKK